MMSHRCLISFHNRFYFGLASDRRRFCGEPSPCEPPSTCHSLVKQRRDMRDTMRAHSRWIDRDEGILARSDSEVIGSTKTKRPPQRQQHRHSPIRCQGDRIRRLQGVLWLVLLSYLAISCLASPVSESSSSSTPPRKPYRSSPPHSATPPIDLPPQHDHEVIRQLVHDLTTRMSRSSALAGKFGRLRSNLFRVVSKQEWYLVYKCLTAANVQWQDLLLLTMLGYLPVPLVKSLMPLQPELAYLDRESFYSNSHIERQAPVYNNLSSEFASMSSSPTRLPLVIAQNIQQLAQITLLVHLVDILQMLAIGLGYVDNDNSSIGSSGAFAASRSVSQFLCATLYAAWATEKVSQLAQWLVRRTYDNQRTRFGDPFERPAKGQLASRRLQQLASIAVYAIAASGYVFWNIVSHWPRMSGILANVAAFVAIGTALVGLVGFVSFQSMLQQLWSGCL